MFNASPARVVVVVVSGGGVVIVVFVEASTPSAHRRVALESASTLSGYFCY